MITKFYNFKYKPHPIRDLENSIKEYENKIINKEYPEKSNYENKKDKEKFNFPKERKDKSSFYQDNKDKSSYFKDNQEKSIFKRNNRDLKENKNNMNLKCSFNSQKKDKIIIKPLNLKNKEKMKKYSLEELSPISKLSSPKILNSNEIFGEEFWKSEFFNGSL